jgi:23S rRNA pseudouridine1911/1915/1917 synthase
VSERALSVPEGARGTRLDRFLAQALGISRSEAQRWIEGGAVDVEGRSAAADLRLHAGESIRVRPMPPPRTEARPDARVPFEVLHVDAAVVVVVKPAGVVVHPAPGHAEGTLVSGLLALGLFRADELEEVTEEGAQHHRPGIVHRLDAGTSGVLVVARTAAAREALKAQFAAHTIERAYEALTSGVPPAGTVSTLHGRHPRERKRFTTRVRSGKRAVSHVAVTEVLAGGLAAHVRLGLETGRTHQLRVHLAEVCHAPILGDPVYGRPPKDARVRAIAERLGHQALHARVLGFVHPETGASVRFEAEPPEDFREALEGLRGIT